MAWFAGPGTLGLVFEYFLKTTAVLTLALLAAAAAKRRPAAFRHFVLSFALIGLLLLPVLSLAPAGWRTSLLPAQPVEARVQGPVREVLYSASITVGPADVTPARSVPDTGVTMTGRSAPGTHILSSGSSSPLLSPPASDNSPSVPSAARTNDPGRNILGLGLAVLWSAGLFVLALRLVAGLAAARKLTAEGQALADPLWRDILGRFVALVQLRRKVRLKSHPRILVPLTWGWRRPAILMPAGTEAWTEGVRSSALIHELSHIKRADFLVMLAVRASLAVFWWNPLCWVVTRKLRQEQEIACDELVLRAGIKPSIYAASLLAFQRAAGFRWNPTSALLGILGRSSFSQRLAVILKQKLTFKEVKMKTRIMLAMAIVLAVVFIGTARPAVKIEKRTVTASVVQSTAPAAEAVDSALPAAVGQDKQTEKADAAQQEEEKAKAAQKAEEAEKAEKEKPVVEKKIVIETEKGAKPSIEVVITEGAATKMLVLEKPLTITLSQDGKALVLATAGKEFQVLKGEPLRLEIKGSTLQVLKEGQVCKVSEGDLQTIVKEGGKEGDKIVVVKVKEAKPGKTADVWAVKESDLKPIMVSIPGDKDLLDKVRHIREQAEAVKARKMDIAALEDSLKKLEAELQAKEETMRKLEIKLGKTVDNLALGTCIEPAVGKAVGSAAVKVIVKDGNTIQIIYLDRGTSDKDYERVVARLKKDLPEGTKLADSGFDAESGTMSFKIGRPEGAKADEELIHKLVEIIKNELKTTK